ncbi:MAG: acyltransferase family protein [Micrococcaceae bacterium]
MPRTQVEIRENAGAEETAHEKGLPPRRYRPELHGVRGIAILGVVLFHLFGDGRTSGGIDIFLAVSGFLFTASLLREAADSGGRIDFIAYFSRLARRILAPAVIVVALTLAGGLVVLPYTRHQQLWAEARSSFLYFENIELINSQLAYGAAGPETSPFQHFWSLSVQGQFYLLWPIVAVIAVLIAKRLRIPAVKVMSVLVAAILITSFLFATYMGTMSQDESYLMTRTRLWQLAFGGILALMGARLSLHRDLRFAGGWLGFALIATCGFVLNGANLFPGPYAMWPLLGLALVMASASPDGDDPDTRLSAARILSHSAFDRLGRYSYGLYLWHWPLLIFYLEVRDQEKVGPLGAVAVMTVTIALAVLTYHLVERPLKARPHDWNNQRFSKVVVTTAAGILAVCGIGTTLQVSNLGQKPSTVFTDWDWESYPGATTVSTNEPTPDVDEFLPDLSSVSALQPEYYEWGCRQSPSDPGTGEVSVCEDPNDPVAPDATVVLAGGSHAGQWHPAWSALAEENNWRLLVVDRSGCTFRSVRQADDDACEAWNIRFLDWLEDNDVDLVVTPGTTTHRDFESEAIQGGAPDRWQDIIDRDTELLLVRGIPRPEQNAADCIASSNDPLACGPPIDRLAETNPLDEVELHNKMSTVDLSDAICPRREVETAETCSAVVGNVVVWYDDSHLTRTFVKTLTPILEDQLRSQVPWLFGQNS